MRAYFVGGSAADSSIKGTCRHLLLSVSVKVSTKPTHHQQCFCSHCHHIIIIIIIIIVIS